MPTQKMTISANIPDAPIPAIEFDLEIVHDDGAITTEHFVSVALTDIKRGDLTVDPDDEDDALLIRLVRPEDRDRFADTLPLLTVPQYQQLTEGLVAVFLRSKNRAGRRKS